LERRERVLDDQVSEPTAGLHEHQRFLDRIMLWTGVIQQCYCRIGSYE
jgi:hypothetical protein